MQDWPDCTVAPQATRSAATPRSALTITGALPPSSSVTRLRPAWPFSDQPTAGLPVKVSSLMRSSSTSGRASSVDDGTTAMPSSGARLEDDPRELQGRDRRLGGRPDDDRVAGGEGRCDLVRDE